MKKLIRGAMNGKTKAYAPYSNFRVGAALLSENDEIIIGCNIENISFSPTVCAERVAFFSAITSGISKFKAIAIATDDPQFSSPCGVCRQVMSEFVENDFKIIMINDAGESLTSEFSTIFPSPFTPSKRIGKNTN